MTIQFRSRIKPAIDYSTVLNSYGFCCSSTNPSSPTRKSFIECFNEGGHFIPGESTAEIICPDADLRSGCCCACSYVNAADRDLIRTASETNPYLASGCNSGVSKCECERLGGKWTSGSCPSLTSSNWAEYSVVTTPEGNYDVRASRSCCHLGFDDITGWPTVVECKDVCSSYECALLSTEVYPSIYGGGTGAINIQTRCAIPLIPGGIVADCITNEYLQRMMRTDFPVQLSEVGSCYKLIRSDTDYKYDCSITDKLSCDSENGYWVESLKTNNAFCVTDYQPTDPVKENSFYRPQKMTLANFNSLGLTSGDEFLGGVYIGIFNNPLTNTGSETIGNLRLNNPIVHKVEYDGIPSTNDVRWALIVDERKFKVPFLLETENDIDFQTSTWDGYYNTYGNNSTFNGIQTSLTNSIKFVPRNGFLDYYLPSIEELNFYAYYLKKNSVTTVGNFISSTIFNTKYLGTTIKTPRIKNNTFVYAQGIVGIYNKNYKNLLINKYNTETAMFFRRIILE